MFEIGIVPCNVLGTKLVPNLWPLPPREEVPKRLLCPNNTLGSSTLGTKT